MRGSILLVQLIYTHTLDVARQYASLYTPFFSQRRMHEYRAVLPCCYTRDSGTNFTIVVADRIQLHTCSCRIILMLLWLMNIIVS
jgi:hypothetical protein